MITLSRFDRLAGQLMLGPNGELGHITEAKTFVADATLARTFGNYGPKFLQAYVSNPDDHRFRIGLVYHSKQPKQWGTETLMFTDATVRTLYPNSGTGKDELTMFQQKKRENSVHYGTGVLLEYILKDSPQTPVYIPILYDRGTVLADYRESMTHLLDREDPATPVLEVLNLIGPAAAARQNIEAFVALKDLLMRTLVKKDMRKSLEAKLAESMRGTGAAATSPAQNAPTFAPSAPRPVAPIAPSVKLNTPTLNPDRNSKQWYAKELDDPTCRKLESYLRMPLEHTEPETLRQFVRFREFTVDQLNELAASCPIYSAPQGTMLLEQGTTDQWNLYLLNGQIQLMASDGEKKIISAETPNAASAIAALKPRKFSVAATTPVRFLMIHEAIIAEILERRPGTTLTLV